MGKLTDPIGATGVLIPASPSRLPGGGTSFATMTSAWALLAVSFYCPWFVLELKPGSLMFPRAIS